MPRTKCRRQEKSSKRTLPTVANVDDVAVFHDILLAFNVELASFLELYFRGVPGVGSPDQIAVFHHLGADETAGEVGLNAVRRIDGRGAVTNGPGADFVFAACEKRDVTERLVEKTREN